jgi:hypothetical protein
MPEALYVLRCMQVLELLAFQPLSAPQVASIASNPAVELHRGIHPDARVARPWRGGPTADRAFARSVAAGLVSRRRRCFVPKGIDESTPGA